MHGLNFLMEALFAETLDRLYLSEVGGTHDHISSTVSSNVFLGLMGEISL